MAKATVTPEPITFLDLDALIPETQHVKLRGTMHAVVPPTTEMYLELIRAKQNVRRAPTEEDEVNETINLIMMCAPSIERADLVGLPVKALRAFSDMVGTMMQDAVGDDLSGEGEGTDLGE